MVQTQLSWHTPEEILEIGFSRSPIVMINEAHHGALRCVRTRQVGVQLLPTAQRLGVRYLAMEMLFPAYAEEANRTRTLPDLDALRSVEQAKPEHQAWMEQFMQRHEILADADYLAQPEMREFIQSALDLDFTLIAYEADLTALPAQLSGEQETNWREEAQAQNLFNAFQELPMDARLLVWSGNHHLTKNIMRGPNPWLPMGYQFKKLSHRNAFAIDQVQTVKFPFPDSFRDKLRRTYISQLPAGSSTMGVLTSDLPMLLRQQLGSSGVNAFLFSSLNELE
ncbi:hypothetical protein [Dictyobacter kobayashii]|uniref:Haem-binding uptake Tiki superfamily ChaN domain-containing protein n=1 Tax=Dictyobacter kobayashii TaxID=2014872 RepID=A0A402AY92_9CHLR|nr:hypothetical protein [Dictyobacter kobayashii]GCE24076.1 hypothetical protein KDK_78760 [Dictyobacter kobayashii]